MRRRIRHNLAFLCFCAVLMALSAFFTVQVEAFRAAGAKARIVGAIESGAEVTVVEIIDGDEVAVRGDGGAFVVRLLGIKAFAPKVHDPQLADLGLRAFLALERALEGQTVTLEVGEPLKDERGRVLAYVEKDGEDIGRELLERGLVLAYVLYPSPREDAYRRVQAEARDAARGLWGVPGAAERAGALLTAWEAERER